MLWSTTYYLTLWWFKKNSFRKQSNRPEQWEATNWSLAKRRNQQTPVCPKNNAHSPADDVHKSMLEKHYHCCSWLTSESWRKGVTSDNLSGFFSLNVIGPFFWRELSKFPAHDNPRQTQPGFPKKWFSKWIGSSSHHFMLMGPSLLLHHIISKIKLNKLLNEI